MLSKRENMVMSAVYELCDGTDCCLISRADILSLMPKKAEFSSESLDDILFSLHVDGYFDLITSERKGERMYVVTLKESGYAFKRAQKQRRRDITFKIFLAFIGAAATFVFGLILRGIFGG
ncbi:MAG TPA: hypothetical protein IAC90_04155 [Candidatus Coproplasma stercorigallinarum]|nr:hypothetical protein [Candidatus Coproplasma stercorigallinarum]